MPVYPNNQTSILYADHYFNYFKKRGLQYVEITRTKTFEKSHNLEVRILTEHVWNQGDNLLKISRAYFGSSEFWWAIGFLNNKPTDAHYSIGDVVIIPTDPNAIVEAFR
jgi:hypothetical protein